MSPMLSAVPISAVGNSEVGELHPRPGYDPDTSAPPLITLGVEGSITPATLTRVS